MFERKKYKIFAKKQLKGRWTVPVVMTLIITVIMFLFSIPDLLRVMNDDNFWELVNYQGDDIYAFTALFDEVNRNSSSILTSVIQTIVEAILSIASINLYLKMSRTPEKVSLRPFIEGLNNWTKAFLAALWKYLWIFIWSLFFIIPGIIKSIAYSQMYYILAEYPDVSVTKSMRISMIITQGHKGDLFITYLSFLGWMFLCVLTFGIGVLWLEPYMNMTLINAYHSLMKEALETGKLKPEDLTE